MISCYIFMYLHKLSFFTNIRFFSNIAWTSVKQRPDRKEDKQPLTIIGIDEFDLHVNFIKVLFEQDAVRIHVVKVLCHAETLKPGVVLLVELLNAHDILGT